MTLRNTQIITPGFNDFLNELLEQILLNLDINSIARCQQASVLLCLLQRPVETALLS